MNIVNLIREAVSGAGFHNIDSAIPREKNLPRPVPIGSRVRIYALLCAAIAATGSMARGDWTQFRFDPTHHGVAPDETILSPANVANLTVKWRYRHRRGLLCLC